MASLFEKLGCATQLVAFWQILFISFGALILFLSSSHVAAARLYLNDSDASLASATQNSEANAPSSVGASLDNRSQAFLSSWATAGKSNSPCNSWFGIKCSVSNSITQIELNDSGLSGPLHTLIFSSFPSLIELNFSNNNLSGTIPSEINKLTNLVSLDLNSNLLNGSIPIEIGTLRNLDTLDLSFNSLSGTIPATIRNITKLKRPFPNDN